MSFWDNLKSTVSNTISDVANSDFTHAAAATGDAIAGQGKDFYNELYWAATAVRAKVGIDSEADLQSAAKAAGVNQGPDQGYWANYKAQNDSTAAAFGGGVANAVGVADATPGLGWVVDKAMTGFEDTYRAGVSAAIVATPGGNFFDPTNWKNAWAATSNADPNNPGVGLGEALSAHSQDELLNPAGLAKYRDEIKSSWGLQAQVDAFNILGYFAFDPTRGVGRAVKAARVAKTIDSSTQAEKAFEASQGIAFGEAKGARHVDQAKDFVTPKGMGPTANGVSAKASLDELDHLIAKTEKGRYSPDALPRDHELAQIFQRVARSGGGAGTSNVLFHLFNHAQEIVDPVVRTTAKRNIILAGAGSKGALDALVKDSPELARAMERMTTAPEGMDVLDDLARASKLRADISFSDIAERIAENPANKAELEGMAKRLDDFHGRLRELDDRLYGTDGGGQMNRVVGLTAFDKLAAGLHARVGASHTYQDGVGSRTAHAITWATGKVAPGTIDTVDAFTGTDQFASTLKASGVYTGSEVADLSNRFRGLGQNERNMFVSGEMERMVNKMATEKWGMDPEKAKAVTADIMGRLVNGRNFASRALAKSIRDEEKAAAKLGNQRLRANAPKGTVKLHEPNGQSVITVDHGLLQTHLANSAVSVDPKLVDKVLRYHSTDKMTLNERIMEKESLAGDFAGGMAQAYTNLWKFGVLGRPGLATRALLDTQVRSVALIGAYESLLNATKGTGHMVTRLGYRALKRENLFYIPPTVEDLKAARVHDARIAHLESQLDSLQNHTFRDNGSGGAAFSKDGQLAYGEALGRPMRSPKIDAIAERNQLKRDQLFERHQDLQAKLETLRGRRPKSVKQQAQLERMVANAEARADKVKEQLDRAYDPTHIAKAARKGYLKGNATHRANRSHEQAMRDAITAHQVAADALRDGRYEQFKLGLGVKAKNLRLDDGQSMELSPAYRTAQDQDEMSMLLTDGGGAASSVMTANLASDTNRVRESASSWSANIKPNDPAWSQRYVRATDALRASPTARRLLRNRTLIDNREWHELYDTLRHDKAVKNEWAKMKAIHPDFQSWLHGVVRYVGYYAPNEQVVESLLRGARMSTKDVDRLIPPAERFVIHGPDMEYLQPPEWMQRWINGRDRVYKTLLDKPDLYMVRHPTYVSLYGQYAKKLANRWVRENGDMTLAGRAEIEARARHMAVQDVKRVMYDPSHLTNAHQSLRFISPFIRPWEDAMRSWSRLIYDNPHTLGKLVNTWEAPNAAGLVVDENGYPVPAHAPARPGRQEFIVINMPPALATGLSKATGGAIDAKDLEQFRLRKESFNSISQGETPWLPGFGPTAQIPVQLMAHRFFPEIYNHSGNSVLRSLFLDGTVPKADAWSVVRNQLPGYARAIWDAFDGQAASNARIYQTVINAKIMDAQQNGKPMPSRAELDRAGANAARSGGLIRALASGLLGMSGNATPEGQFYVEQYQILQSATEALTKQGSSVDQKFHELFPEAADLKWSISMNETGINATVKADNRARSLKKLIDADPEYGWAIVGSDNVGGQYKRDGTIDPESVFNGGVYNGQFTNKFGIEGLGRRERTKAEVLDRSLKSAGWAKYSMISAAIQTEMTKRGLSSLNQTDASDLKDAKKAIVLALKKENPTWAAAYEDTSSNGKVDQFLRVADKLMADPKTKDREDILALKTYLQYRTMAQQAAAMQGYTLAATSKAGALRTRLDEIGSALAKQSLGFNQAWERVLAGEVEDRSGSVQ